MKVGLIACGSAKVASGPVRAADLYTGSVFRASRRWAEACCAEWAILSAKYGLLLPDRLVYPYDQRLADASRAQREAWGQQVAGAISERWPAAQFVTTAGSVYRSAIARHLEVSTLWGDRPNMGMGRQLRYLTQEARRCQCTQEATV